MKEYSFVELRSDFEKIGYPIFEAVLNDSVTVVTVSNGSIEYEDSISLWMFENKTNFLGKTKEIKQHECLRITFDCKLYTVDKCLYHPELECIKVINVYDKNNNFIGVLYFPKHCF